MFILLHNCLDKFYLNSVCIQEFDYLNGRRFIHFWVIDKKDTSAETIVFGEDIQLEEVMKIIYIHVLCTQKYIFYVRLMETE